MSKKNYPNERSNVKCVSRTLHLEVFAVLIGACGIIHENLLMQVAIALPAIEGIAGIGLLFDIRGSLLRVAGMLVLFMGVLGYGIWMGLDVDCGCFSSSGYKKA